MPRGYDRPLYIQPFDHRGSLQSGLFGRKPPLSDARIASRYREFVDLFEGK
jgi:hypothetical protein